MNISEIIQYRNQNTQTISPSQIVHSNLNGNYMTESEFNHFKEATETPIIHVPSNAQILLQTLNKAGYEAYLVGGCIRDAILQEPPHDWDICTNATPEEIQQVFEDYPQLDIGIQHGTINVNSDNEWFDITSYRKDGIYKDGRRPSEVLFIKDIKEDLSRRDFTINAIAYANNHFVDPFEGRKDLKHKVICCVGNPDERFSEDALRILRMYRFSLQMNFIIDHNTYVAAKKHLKENVLDNVSAERKTNELEKLLMKPNLSKILSNSNEKLFHEFISCIIPEWKDMNLDQNNPYHIYTVAEHTRQALISLPEDADFITKIAVLLHDIAKPICVEAGEDGINHFYGHASKGAEMAKDILTKLRFDNKSIDLITSLIRQHEYLISKEPTIKNAKKLFIAFHEDKEQLTRFFQLAAADINGQSLIHKDEKLQKLSSFKRCCTEMLNKEQCFKISDLKINGNDLIQELKLKPGKEIGRVLNTLLDMVINEQIQNDKNILLNCASTIIAPEGDILTTVYETTEHVKVKQDLEER